MPASRGARGRWGRGSFRRVFFCLRWDCWRPPGPGAAERRRCVRGKAATGGTRSRCRDEPTAWPPGARGRWPAWHRSQTPKPPVSNFTRASSTSHERLPQRPDQHVDLAPLGGDLAGVGEVLVERQRTGVAVAELGQPQQQVGTLLFEGRAQVGKGHVRWHRGKPTCPNHPGPGMGGFVDALEPLGGHLGVHLGRRDRRVAEQFLDHPDVGPVVEHVGRARVAEHVGGQPVPQPDPVPVAPDDGPRALPGQPPAAAVEEDGLRVAPPGPPLGRHPAPPGRRQPRAQGLAGDPAHRHHPLLRPLPEGPEHARVEVEVGQRQADQLRDPQAAGVEGLEDGPVAAGGGVVAGDGSQQGEDLVLGQGLREAGRHLRGADLAGRVARRLALVLEEAVERAHRHEGSRDRRRGPAGGAEEGHVVLHHRLGDLGDGQLAALQELHVGGQVPAVGGEGVDRTAPLHRQPGQELLGLDREGGPWGAARVSGPVRGSGTRPGRPPAGRGRRPPPGW